MQNNNINNPTQITSQTISISQNLNNSNNQTDEILKTNINIIVDEINNLIGKTKAKLKGPKILFSEDFNLLLQKTKMPEPNTNEDINFLLQTLFKKNETQISNTNKEDENAEIPLSKYYDHVSNRINQFTIKLSRLINRWSHYIQPTGLKENLEIHEILFNICKDVAFITDFFIEFFNKIEKTNSKNTKGFNVNSFENEFSEKLNSLYKKLTNFKNKIEEYRVNQNVPVIENETEDNYYYLINILLEAKNSLIRKYDSLGECIKETNLFNEQTFKTLIKDVTFLLEKSKEISSSLFENGICKRNKIDELDLSIKILNLYIKNITKFTDYLNQNSLNFKNEKSKIIYKAKDEDTKINNIDAKEPNNIKKLIEKINEKFNTPQESIHNDFKFLLKLLLKKDKEIYDENINDEIVDEEIVEISSSEYCALLSNRIKHFITKLNLLIKAWNFYTKQEVDEEFIKKQFEINKKFFDFNKEKLEINKKFFNLCENLNSIIEFYMDYFNLIKKISTSKNFDVNEFENKFSEKLNSLFENLSEIENKIEEFRVNTNIPFFENDELKTKIHLQKTPPFPSYVSSKQSDYSIENKNVFFNKDNVPTFKESFYFKDYIRIIYLIRDLLNKHKYGSNKTVILDAIEKFKNTFDSLYSQMVKYYNNSKDKKVFVEDILKERIDEINNNERLSDELKKAEIKSVKNILSKNKHKKTNVINSMGVFIAKDDINYIKTLKRKMVAAVKQLFKKYMILPQFLNEERFKSYLDIINITNADKFMERKDLYQNIYYGFLYKVTDFDDYIYSCGITPDDINLFKKSMFYKEQVFENLKIVLNKVKTGEFPSQNAKILVQTLQDLKNIIEEFLHLKDEGFINEYEEIKKTNSSIKKITNFEEKFKILIKNNELKNFEEKTKTLNQNIEKNLENLVNEIKLNEELKEKEKVRKNFKEDVKEDVKENIKKNEEVEKIKPTIQKKKKKRKRK